MDNARSAAAILANVAMSRRALLASAAGLGAACLWKPTTAAPTPEAGGSGLRDFAYVATALTLETEERDDLRPLAGIRRTITAAVFDPEALVQAQIFPEAQADHIFAAGAQQLYVYAAESEDQSRTLAMHVVQCTTREGAESVFETIRTMTPPQPADQITPELAPAADAAFLIAFQDTQSGGLAATYNWLQGGVRFGPVVVVWTVGFRDAAPNLALAGGINRVLRDYLTDAGPAARRQSRLPGPVFGASGGGRELPLSE